MKFSNRYKEIVRDLGFEEFTKSKYYKQFVSCILILVFLIVVTIVLATLSITEIW